MTTTPGYTELLQAVHEICDGLRECCGRGLQNHPEEPPECCGEPEVVSELVLARAAELTQVTAREAIADTQNVEITDADVTDAYSILIRTDSGYDFDKWRALIGPIELRLGIRDVLESFVSVKAASPAKDGGDQAELKWALDAGDVLADWCNRSGNALQAMMDAHERRIRTLCTPEQLIAKPWECAEWIEARDALRAKPVAVVEIESQSLASQMRPQSAVQGWITGYLPTQRAVEVVLDNDLPEWIGNKIRVFIAGRATFDAIGRSGQGHNADWCAGWTAHLIASAVPQPPQGEVK